MNKYEKFKNLYEEIDTLIANKVTDRTPDFKAWKSKVERLLINYYGKNSYEYTSFIKRRFSLSVYTLGTPETEFISVCKRELEVTKSVFKDYLEEMEAEYDKVPQVGILEKNLIENKEVFIVHGHDGELKEGLARLLEKQDIKPVILSEQANNGKTIIEKLEGHSNVRAAIILFTKDDVCTAEGIDIYRARQNVVFEAGYFIAKLNRTNVIIIREAGVEIPGDLSGVVYTPKDNWHIEVLKELKNIGLEIDFNKMF